MATHDSSFVDTSSAPVLAQHDPGDEQERLARAISAYVRAEFKAPVDIVTSFIDLLLEDAAQDSLAAYRADLQTMKSASVKLGRTVTQLLDAGASRTSLVGREVDSFAAELRHALRTPITAIMGYAELLLEEAREDGCTSLLETLDALLAAARRLLASIESMVEFINAGSIISRVGLDEDRVRAKRRGRARDCDHPLRFR